MCFFDNQKKCFKYIYFKVALIFRFLISAYKALQNSATRKLDTSLSRVPISFTAL